MKTDYLSAAVLALTALYLALAVPSSAEERTFRAGDYGSKQMKLESKFYGTIEKHPPNMVGVWIVSGRKITVTPDTQIEEKTGKVKVGAHVEVEGYNDLKTFTATEIEVNDNEFYGTIEKLPKDRIGTWTVSGRKIIVKNNTRIITKGRPLKIGSVVKIEGSSQGKEFSAWKISVKETKH